MPVQIPPPVYKPPFNITRASHIVHQVSDLPASRAFYVDLIGLVVSDEDNDTLWLRGLEEACHHSVVLKKGGIRCERVGLRVLTEDDLDRVQDYFAKSGFTTRWVDVAHQGRTLQTTDPAGTPLEFCAVMETRPRLFHHIEVHRGAAAHRLDHFQVVTPQVHASLAFYMGMGFRLSEYVVDDNEDAMMVFLQRKGNPHDIVLANGPGPRLHHFAFTVPETQSLMTAADLFVRAGFADQVEFGPARHFSPGLARFLYLRDPGSSSFQVITRRSTAKTLPYDGARRTSRSAVGKRRRRAGLRRRPSSRVRNPTTCRGKQIRTSQEGEPISWPMIGPDHSPCGESARFLANCGSEAKKLDELLPRMALKIAKQFSAITAMGSL
jgi:catechol 2,3-dioxygenase